MQFNHIISTKQFLDTNILDKLFSLADEMEKLDKQNKLPNPLKGKILAALFYEPSTRTRFSFETAMHKLGGSVISTENAAQFSSAIKGETLQDSIRIISGYADVIVIRHYQEGAARLASEVSSVPIINAGDGIGEHPTQALLDIYTIKKELGDINGLKIALIGDLLNGRTIHSLLPLLSLFDTQIFLVSPEQLKLPEKYKAILREKKIKFEETANLEEVLGKADVFYVTRVQKERFNNLEEYEKLKSCFAIDKQSMEKIKEKAVIMHPLPRITEISTEIDSDKRAAYFRQAKNGLYIRMALLQSILEKN